MTLLTLNTIALCVLIVAYLWTRQQDNLILGQVLAQLRINADELRLLKGHAQVNAHQIDATRRESLETRMTMQEAAKVAGHSNDC